MTTRTWNGSNDSFNNAAAWSPNGVPVSGDTAVINAGSVSLTGTASAITILLSEASGSTASTTLALTNATLDAATTLAVSNANTFNATAPTISISGTVAFGGVGSFTQSGNGAQITVTIGAGSTLVNTGALNFYATSPQVNGGGTLQNNGKIAFLNPTSVAQIPVITDAVTGTGSVALGEHARVDFAGAVGSGQTVVFNDGASGDEILQIDQLANFGATINGFSTSDTIAITNVPYSSFTYTSTGANSGTLNIFNGATLQGSLSLTGQYTASSFSATFNNFGGGMSNLQISTSVVNAVSAGLPSGYQNGGNGTGTGTTVGALYRFFDKTNGTHFFTADAGERNTTINNLSSRYTQETNGFGDVTQSDPNAVAVYRFFDTRFGTHFFTSSAAERDTLIATRSTDLNYEPSSTFYEHSTLQSGDTAVYRLFDQTTGTQFLTGNQTEYAGLTTQGSATYRGDLRSEGVAFYAPTGSFT